MRRRLTMLAVAVAVVALLGGVLWWSMGEPTDDEAAIRRLVDEAVVEFKGRDFDDLVSLTWPTQDHQALRERLDWLRFAVVTDGPSIREIVVMGETATARVWAKGKTVPPLLQTWERDEEIGFVKIEGRWFIDAVKLKERLR